MSVIRLVADSTCDISPELTARYKVYILPLTIVMGEQGYFDGMEARQKDIFKWVSEGNDIPKTAAVSIEQAIELLTPFAKAGDDTIFIGISEKMSTTCNVIRLAANELGYENIRIIDSEAVSAGTGLQVCKAGEMIKAGKSLDEIAQWLEDHKSKVKTSFVVDTLEYLAKGGRCSSVTSLLANTFHIKPMIAIQDGELKVLRKFRGSSRKVLKDYLKSLGDDFAHADTTRVFITHTCLDKEQAQWVKEEVNKLGIFEEIHVTEAGGVISSHCGPNTLGVLFYQV